MNIIVECAVAIAIFSQKPEGIVISKIFELNQGVLAITFHYSVHKFINKIIVFLTSNAFMSKIRLQNESQALESVQE